MQGNTQVKDPEKKIIFEKENCGLEEKAHVSTSFFFFFFSIDNREFQPYFLSTLFLPLRTEQIGFSSRKGLYLFFELAVSLLPSLNTTFQVLMLMKLHTLALSLLFERQMFSFGKEKTHLFFTDDGEQNKRQIIYFITHFTAHQPTISQLIIISMLRYLSFF